MKLEKLNVNFIGFGIWVTKGPSTQDPAGVFKYTVNVMFYRWKWNKSFGQGPGNGKLVLREKSKREKALDAVAARMDAAVATSELQKPGFPPERTWSYRDFQMGANPAIAVDNNSKLYVTRRMHGN
jgi:hypothetical protein